MEVTYDEYIATWQAPEAKEALNERIEQDRQERYRFRMGLNADYPENNRRLARMPIEEFESIRKHQMAQLYEVYKNAYSGGYHSSLSIRPGTTNPELLRRVIGDQGGYIYNTGIFALDEDTISAVKYIAELRESTSSGYIESNWARGLSSYGLEKAVDEMITAKNILIENSDISYKDTMYGKIFKETNIAKRAIGKVQYATAEDRFLDHAKVGINCFGIKDYELNWQQLMERKSKNWSKVGSKLLGFLSRKLNLKSKDNDPDRIGNRTMNIGDER